MRKVAVFGATGQTGRLVVEEARGRGWSVRVLVRDEAKAPAEWWRDQRLEVVVGDATVAASVAETIVGVDAVLDTLGHARGAPRDVLERSMRHIVEAMRHAGVGRIVSLAGAGVRQRGDRPRAVDRVFQALVRWVRRALFVDNVARVAVLQATALEWTVSRVSWLADRAPGRDLYVGPLGGAGMGLRIARADVARWMVEEVEARRHVREAPVVATRRG